MTLNGGVLATERNFALKTELSMAERKTSKSGLPYLTETLKRSKLVETKVALWEIAHNNSANNEFSMRLGRYQAGTDDPETLTPKSQLTLDGVEFSALLAFLRDDLQPFQLGVSRWVPLGEDLDEAQVEQLKTVFANPDRRALIELLEEHDVLPADLLASLEHRRRCRAVDEFRAMLERDLTEAPWQRWFEENDWVLGTEFVRVLDERDIDTDHIADYLMQAYDGFLDVVEIKRPGGNLNFWSASTDHGNSVPHSDLIKAVTQASRYILEIERECDSVKFQERVDGVPTVKPRGLLIYGRSSGWTQEQCESYRVLNAGYHNLSIMTFDHVLARAERALGLNPTPVATDTDDLPF